MPKQTVYRNILLFLIGLFLLNLCIGFYGSMKNVDSNKSTSINYIVQDKEIAMELTIEAFGKAFNNLSSYSSNFAFSTWLFSIAKNNCIDFLRKKKIKTLSLDNLIEQADGYTLPIDIEDQKLVPDEYLIKKQRILFLRKLVDRLKPNYHLLIKLRYFKEYSYEEIAVELDLPLGTVKAQLHRSREHLFKLLSGMEDLL